MIYSIEILYLDCLPLTCLFSQSEVVAKFMNYFPLLLDRIISLERPNDVVGVPFDNIRNIKSVLCLNLFKESEEMAWYCFRNSSPVAS